MPLKLKEKEGPNITIEKIIVKIAKMSSDACPTCATYFEARSLEHALMRLSGISKVRVDEVAGKISIEYDVQKISILKITERLEKLGYRVENVSRGIS